MTTVVERNAFVPPLRKKRLKPPELPRARVHAVQKKNSSLPRIFPRLATHARQSAIETHGLEGIVANHGMLRAQTPTMALSCARSIFSCSASVVPVMPHRNSDTPSSRATNSQAFSRASGGATAAMRAIHSA